MDHVFYGQNGEHLQGVATQEEIEALNKALTVGYGYSGEPQQLTGGAALTVESLDASLKSTTWQMRNLVLWPSLPMDRAFNTVEQYTRITSYGSNGSPYFTEGGSPREEDSRYNREIQKVVYLGTRRRVSHPMMLVKTNYGDAVAREINAGNMWLLQNIERELYKGNGDFSNAGNFDGNAGAIPNSSLALNGLSQQIRSGDTDSKAQAVAFSGYSGSESVVRSLGGSLLTEDEMENGAVSILNNFGVPVECHLDPISLSQFSRQFFSKERINDMGVLNGRAGFVLTSFCSSGGEFVLRPNVFLNPKTSALSTPQNSSCPAQPVAPTTSNGGSNVSTTFALTETYYYKVAACNEAGEGAASAASAQETITTAGEQINVSIAHTGLLNFTHFAVYRTVSAGATGTEQFIGYVAAAAASPTTFVDKNKRLPGSAEAFLLFLDQDAIGFKQLTPLSKINLATVAASFEWLQVLYGCLISYAPRKNFVYENIGRQ